MRDQLSQSTEDYLKTIYTLTSEQGRASTTQIAERMGVTPASVTGMMQKLAANQPPLVDYQKHRGVVLTEAGKTIALELIRHHRLLELFLTERLGYTWDEVHAEADRLEHFISEELEERIAQALGNPSHDPHGDPIPTRDFQLPPSSNLRLSELRAGHRAVVERVNDTDPDLLRYLTGLCLVPGANLEVLEHNTFDDNLTIQVDGCDDSAVVGPRISNKIFVTLKKP